MQSNPPFKILFLKILFKILNFTILHTKLFIVVTLNHYELGSRVDGKRKVSRSFPHHLVFCNLFIMCLQAIQLTLLLKFNGPPYPTSQFRPQTLDSLQSFAVSPPAWHLCSSHLAVSQSFENATLLST